jgi:hypothetical protein
VWVKFQASEGARANRRFYDKVSDTEITRAVNTRNVAGWLAAAATTQPGAEWIQLYEVDWDGAGFSTSTVTDVRVFLFEGHADSSPAFSSTWGFGDDRNADRATNGVKTLDRFAAAVLKKLEEIQSSTARWWTAPVEPLDEKVSRNGDLTLTGNYKITGDLELTGSVVGNLEVDNDIITGGTADIGGGLAVAGAASIFDTLTLQTTQIGASPTGSNQHLFLRTLDDTVDSDDSLAAVVSIGMLLGSATPDGWAVYGWRNADDVPMFTLRAIVDGALDNRVLVIDKDAIQAHQKIGLGNTGTGDIGANAMNAATMPKAWGVYTVDDSGNVTTLSDWNISSVVTATNKIVVTLLNSMGNQNWGVVATSRGIESGAAVNHIYITKVVANNQFELTVIVPEGPSTVDPTNIITGLAFQFLVFGKIT